MDPHAPLPLGWPLPAHCIILMFNPNYTGGKKLRTRVLHLVGGKPPPKQAISV